MAKMTEYAVTDAEQWNQIVRSFENYDVFYLSEYVTAFMPAPPNIYHNVLRP